METLLIGMAIGAFCGVAAGYLYASRDQEEEIMEWSQLLEAQERMAAELKTPALTTVVAQKPRAVTKLTHRERTITL